MKYSKLGSSDLNVSDVCLGTMTWGVQNNQADANQQLDYAIGKGINFVDTAEMYAVPPSKDTYGLTEKMIGNWLADNQSKRQDIVLASKVAGPGVPWVRDAGLLDGKAVTLAVEGSLQRLQTDQISNLQT